MSINKFLFLLFFTVFLTCFSTVFSQSQSGQSTVVVIEKFRKQTLEIGIVIDCSYVNSTTIRASIYRYSLNNSRNYGVEFKFYTESSYASNGEPYAVKYFPRESEGDAYINAPEKTSIVVIRVLKVEEQDGTIVHTPVYELGPYRVSWIEPSQVPSFLIDYVPFLALALLTSLVLRYRPVDVAIGLIIYGIFCSIFLPLFLGFQSQSLYSSSIIAIVIGIVLIFVSSFSREVEMTY
ncbi:MAG: hypothetical protein QXX12_00720 [Nanopusillaceae archaeon]